MKKTLVVSALLLASLALPISPAHAAGSTGTTGVATGDFNGDGHDDLAVGSPGEDVGEEGSEIELAGQVNVIYGSSTGLKSANNQVFAQDTPGVLDEAEQLDSFGNSVAAGDFNGDGRDDLAIGATGEGVGTESDNDEATGAVHILFGKAGGLSTNNDQFLHQDSPGILDSATDQDKFGASLAAGDFGGNNRDDLAVGIPSEDLSSELENAGAVAVLRGSNEGLTAQGDQFWHQDSSEIAGVAGAIEEFGFSLAAANFGRDSHRDLAVGVPGDTAGEINDIDDVGAVNVLYGSPDGLGVDGNQRWTQNSSQNGAEIRDASETDDSFGWSLSAGNLGRSRFADLVVGAPYEDIGDPTVQNAGSVNVIYGTDNGLRVKGNQFFTRSTPGVPLAAEEFANFGNTVAVGNLGKTGISDLAVGSVFEDLSAPGGDEGEVTVLYGKRKGLRTTGSQSWTQDTVDGGSEPDQNDFFGGSAAIGDFGKSNQKDLTVGVPGEDVGAGAVEVFYGKQTGLAPAGDQFWQQGNGLPGVAEEDDNFGAGRYD